MMGDRRGMVMALEAIWAKALPFWPRLSDDCKRLLSENILLQTFEKGTFLYYGGGMCTGLELVSTGQVRVFINSPNGGEITLYRLLEGDICILSAACMIKNLDFDIHMEIEEHSELYVIPRNIYQQLSEKSAAVKDFTLELVASRFSDVMWLMNQLVFSNMGKRLAQALLDRSRLAKGGLVVVTHDAIAKDLGTAREVVTRLLKQFQLDGLVSLSRGNVRILDAARLREIAIQ